MSPDSPHPSSVPLPGKRDTKKESWRKAKDFGRRQDVINKTLLRSIKKHLTSDFNKVTGFDDLSYEDRLVHYRELLENYVDLKYRGEYLNCDYCHKFYFLCQSN